jgi:hypothetical protein
MGVPLLNLTPMPCHVVLWEQASTTRRVSAPAPHLLPVFRLPTVSSTSSVFVNRIPREEVHPRSSACDSVMECPKYSVLACDIVID